MIVERQSISSKRDRQPRHDFYPASDPSLTNVWLAGERLMRLSNLNYRGRLMDVGRWRGVHVMEFGSGRPLFLIHGAGAGGAIWHRQIAALAMHRRVIVPEIPLFGLSAMPEEIPPIRSATGELILNIMDAFGLENADIAGISLGGLIALGSLEIAAERFGRAVLISSAGLGRHLPWAFRMAHMPILGPMISHPRRFMVNLFFNRMEAQMSDPSEERELVKNYQYSVSARHGRPCIFREGIRKFAALDGQRDVTDEETLIRIPNQTLFIWGANDRFFPLSHPHRAVGMMPAARLEVIPNCGHLIPVEAPRRLTQLMLRWLL